MQKQKNINIKLDQFCITHTVISNKLAPSSNKPFTKLICLFLSHRHFIILADLKELDISQDGNSYITVSSKILCSFTL